MTIVLPILTEKDVVATTAVFFGRATADQQKHFFNEVVVKKLARRLDSVWVPGPDGGRDTDFESGRQWVGVMLNNMLNPQFLEDVKAGKYAPAKPAPPRAPTVNRKRQAR